MARDAVPYNGYTNYATWRAAAEICNDYMDQLQRGREVFPDTNRLADHLEEYVGEIVFCDDPDQETFSAQYAQAFFDDVNWEEIAESGVELGIIESEDHIDCQDCGETIPEDDAYETDTENGVIYLCGDCANIRDRDDSGKEADIGGADPQD